MRVQIRCVKECESVSEKEREKEGEWKRERMTDDTKNKLDVYDVLGKKKNWNDPKNIHLLFSSLHLLWQLHRYFSDSIVPGTRSKDSSSGIKAKKYREKFHWGKL